ncbi:MAG: ATPase [Pseudomonadota bacterium]
MSGTGFPQLDPSSYPSQLFWLAVAFAALYALLSKIALPRVSEVLEMRRSQKNGDLARAGQLSEEAEQIRVAYEKSLAMARRAAADALASSGRALGGKISEEQARFAKNSRKRLAAAEHAIAEAKTAALHSLLDISSEIAAEMAYKIAAVRFSDADARKAVAAVMQKG